MCEPRLRNVGFALVAVADLSCRRYESTNVANVDRVEAALHALFADSEINGKRVLLSKMVGAGTASGSFDRDGYCV